MKGVIVDGVFRPFRQIPVLPDGFPGPVIQASTIFFVKGNFGKVTCQRLFTGPFEIWYSLYQVSSDCEFRFHHKRAFLGIHAVLKTDISYAIAGLENILFKESQCNFFYLPLLDARISLQKGFVYQCLDICIRPGQIRQHLALFPAGKTMAEKLFQKKATALHPIPVDMSFAMKGIVQEIVAFPPDLDLQDLFCKIKIAVFLFHLFHRPNPDNTLSTEMRYRFQEAKNHIEKNYAQHFSIHQLARKAGMNSTSFKVGFKKTVGMGPFAFLIETRMQRAIELLRKRDMPIQQVADQTGYKSFGSFIKAFKRRFGTTPGQIRKKFPPEPF